MPANDAEIDVCLCEVRLVQRRRDHDATALESDDEIWWENKWGSLAD